MSYLARFLAKKRGAEPAVIFSNAPEVNLRNLQNQVSEVSEVPFSGLSENHEADRPLVVPTPILSVAVPVAPTYPPAIAGLVESYLAIFRRVNDLDGAELHKATGSLLDLAAKINRLAPGFDWPALREREGVVKCDPPIARAPIALRNAGAQRADNPTATWDAATIEAIAWLEIVPTPSAPFRLDTARKVLDPEQFVARLRLDVAAGPDGPRARTGALQEDLAKLRGVVAAMLPIGNAGEGAHA